MCATNLGGSGVVCPVPLQTDDCITLAHGEGGRLMRRFISERVLPCLGGENAEGLNDAAVLARMDARLAMTTDSFIISPLIFPGGDIGSLAVYGTVNDLAVTGARPHYLSLSLILEEGLELAKLDRILRSVAAAADEVGVRVVTGDTKVAPRGAVDGVFINTTGVGEVLDAAPPGPPALEVGDEILVTGPIGRHGIAVMAARNQLRLDPAPTSDCASLVTPCMDLVNSRAPVVAMRDATRGGVAAVLHEWADDCGHTFSIDEKDLPVTADVRGACEVLGLDPLHSANEGTMLVAVRPGGSANAIEVLQACQATAKATRIGEVRQRDAAPVTVRRALGHETPLDEPLGAPLPRIC